MTYLLDHTKTLCGIIAIIVGIVIGVTTFRNWAGYLAADEKFTVSATCIGTEQSTYYDSSKPIDRYNAPYEATWQFEVNGETRTFTTKEEYANPVSKSLTFYVDKDGNLQQVNGGPFRAIVALVVCVGGGGVLVYDDNKELRMRLRHKKKSRDEARSIVELNKRERERQLKQQNKD